MINANRPSLAMLRGAIAGHHAATLAGRRRFRRSAKPYRRARHDRRIIEPIAALAFVREILHRAEREDRKRETDAVRNTRSSKVGTLLRAPSPRIGYWPFSAI